MTKIRLGRLGFGNMSNNIRFYIWNGILFTLMTSFSRTYAIKFLFRIGGNEHHASLFNALPGFIAVFATIPGIIWLNKTINKKKTMSAFFWGSRIITLLFAFIPFIPTAYQPMGFVMLYSIMNFPEAASVTALQSYSGDIFLPAERATAISLRNKFSTLAQVISFIILGELLSSSGKSDKHVIIMYQIFFVVAFVLGIFEILTFHKLKETSCSIPASKIELRKSIKDIFNNKRFSLFLVCSLLFHFGWQMGWPLFSIYQIKYLGADEGWLTILNITSNLVMFFSYSYWNRMIKRKGNPFVMAVTTLGMAATPILFALSPNLYVMTVTGLVTGFFTSGTTTVILSSLLEVSPEGDRILYVGIHATLTNITLAIAPIIGDRILSASSIYMALVATAFFRFIGSFALFIRSKRISTSTSYKY